MDLAVSPNHHSQHPLKTCPWEAGKGDGCSLALGTNERVKHSWAGAGDSREDGVRSRNWLLSLLCSPNFLTPILRLPPLCADSVPCFRHRITESPGWKRSSSPTARSSVPPEPSCNPQSEAPVHSKRSIGWASNKQRTLTWSPGKCCLAGVRTKCSPSETRGSHAWLCSR